VVVELWVNGEWIDITSYTMVRDNSGQVRLTKGIRDEGGQTDHATSGAQLRNTDGRFSPRNPVGSYFGLIGRNQPIRFSVPDGNGGKCYRLWAEVSDWAQDWEASGNDVWTDVAVSGIIHRLAQAPPPERSVIYRAITDPPLTGLVAYWPCEDPTGAMVLASALTNGGAMTWTGNPVLATYDGFGGSDPLPTLTGASLTGGVTRYDTTSVTQYQMRYLLAVPAAGFTDLDVISRVTVDQGAYSLKRLDVHYNDPPGGVGSFGGRGTLSVQAYDGDESPLAVSGTQSISLDCRGRRLRVSLEVANNGTDLSMTLRVLDVDTGITDSTTIGLVSTQVTRVTEVGMAPDTLAGDAGVIEAAVGHVLVQTTITDIEDIDEAIQPSGEAAGRRIQRLCGEEGIPFEWIGDLDDTALMGGQGRQNPLAVMRECVEADGGMLYETTNVLGLGYRTRASLYNQDPALVLDYAGYQLAQVPVPVEDDQRIANRVTVTVNGVSATYEETEGALSTALPPAGAGAYGPPDVALNLASSDPATLLDQAAWRVHLGTVDEARHPQISVNLAHPSFVDNPALKRAVLALRQGDRVQVENPPSWLPPDTIDQLILGMEESLTHFEHRLTFVCAPASPYTVGVLDSDGTRLDTDGSELAQAVSSAATTLDVSTTSGPIWVSDADEFPFDVRAGGEVMTVSSISPHPSDTFTRSSGSGWGTSSSGHTWTETGGAVGDRTVTGTAGVIDLGGTPTTIRFNTLADGVADTSVLVSISPGQVSTGNSLAPGVVMRWTDSSNFYRVRLLFWIAADGQTVGHNTPRGNTRAEARRVEQESNRLCRQSSRG
jgi:hypothetical protein